MSSDAQLISLTEACSRLGISDRTFRTWRLRGQAPSPSAQLGRNFLFDAERIDALKATRPPRQSQVETRTLG